MSSTRMIRCSSISNRCLLLCTILLLAASSCCYLTFTSATSLTHQRRIDQNQHEVVSSISFNQLKSSIRHAAGASTGGGAGTGGAPAGLNIAVHAEMSDPITKLLHSQWVWLIFVFVILIVVCVIGYCFRDQVAICVACMETCIYHTIKLVLLPLKLIMKCIRACFYPVKQCFFGGKDRCTRYFYPAEKRVAGLRY